MSGYYFVVLTQVLKGSCLYLCLVMRFLYKTRKWRNNNIVISISSDIIAHEIKYPKYAFPVNPFSTGTIFIRQNLTSVDVRF